jgi:hypothetical protein
MPPSTIPTSRTLVQLGWRENVPSKSWKPSNDPSTLYFAHASDLKIYKIYAALVVSVRIIRM